MPSALCEAHTDYFFVDTVGTGTNIDKVEHGSLLTRGRREAVNKSIDEVCMLDGTRSYKCLAEFVDIGVDATYYAGLERNVLGFTFDVVLYGSIKLKSSTATTFCSITN